MKGKNIQNPLGSYIQSINTNGSGAGETWDIITLKDGRILCITDEFVTKWRSMKEFRNHIAGDYMPDNRGMNITEF